MVEIDPQAHGGLDTVVMNGQPMPYYPPLPTRVRIGPHWFKIIISEERMNKVQVDYRTFSKYGFSLMHENTIVLKPGCPFSLLQETLLHELMHCCNHTSAISVNWDHPHTEEEFIETLDSPLLMILQENPELVTYLTFKSQE